MLGDADLYSCGWSLWFYGNVWSVCFGLVARRRKGESVDCRPGRRNGQWSGGGEAVRLATMALGGRVMGSFGKIGVGRLIDTSQPPRLLAPLGVAADAQIRLPPWLLFGVYGLFLVCLRLDRRRGEKKPQKKITWGDGISGNKK